ncbi:hypothetical protein NSQ77_18195 [Oceanobacillus sp. FSL K6-2867]|uniref:hypothetical protein n=1 Tax=Oceanobacillus sp. FSL K6-2867 TaxID=2954748 RepID=UPI0030D9BAD2
MEQYELYNTQEIEKLNQELEYYKYTLKSLKIGDMIDDYVKTKNDFHQLKLKFSQLEGDVKIMENNFQSKIEDYEHQEKELTEKINSINDSVMELRQDFNKVIVKVEQMRFTDLLEHINHVILKQDNMIAEGKSEINRLRGEILQLKEHFESNNQKQNTTIQHSPKQSEYRKLQNMLDSSRYIEQAPQKKNDVTNFRGFTQSQTMHRDQTVHSFDSAKNGQNHSQKSKGKKTYRHNQYELNKNIITRTTKSNNQDKKKDNNNMNENDSFSTDSENPILSGNYVYLEKNEANLMDVENHLETTTNNTIKQQNEPFNDSELQSSQETTAEEISSNEEDGEKETTSQEKQSNSKKEFASFFSLFQKK